MSRAALLPPTLVAAATALLGCERDDPLAAPTVHLGEDICAVCSMIVSDERFAAACVVRTAAGGHEPRLFDDLGCLLAFDRDAGAARIAAGYVRDYEDGTWVAWDAAHYVYSPSLPTPMGTGLAATRDASAADDLRGRHGGERLDLAGAREHFRRSGR